MADQDIFDEYLNSRSLFHNKEVLRHAYTPAKLPHRDREINFLASVLVSALKGETPSNIFIYGKTGTGKTASVQYIGKEIEKKSRQMTREGQQFLIDLMLEYVEGDSGVVHDLTDRDPAKNFRLSDFIIGGSGPANGNGMHSARNSMLRLDQFMTPPESSDGETTELSTDTPGKTEDIVVDMDQSFELISLCRDTLSFEEFFSEEVSTYVQRPVNYIYINCQHVDTQYRVLTHIANKFVTNWNERLPLTGWPIDEVYNRLKGHIEKFGGVAIIILDEIDKLVEKSGDDLLYVLSRINSDLFNAKANVIGISNDLNFFELLDERVKSSLGGEELIFPPYNAQQLEDILNHRATLAFPEGVISPGLIPLCSACAAQEHGDARRALDLLRVSAEIAEREGNATVTDDYVHLARHKIELDRVTEVVRTLPLQSKIVLYSIIVLNEATNRINAGDVYDLYREMCNTLDISCVGTRRLTDYVSELEMLGIINAKVISLGRHGRTRQIEIKQFTEKIKNVLVEDDYIQEIEHISPQYLQALIA